jgi:hypothetical protein
MSLRRRQEPLYKPNTLPEATLHEVLPPSVNSRLLVPAITLQKPSLLHREGSHCNLLLELQTGTNDSRSPQLS